MKTKTAIRISTMLIALALAGASHAQLKEPPIPGTYYSAKDFEWMPPWPFNPNPELEAVEVEPGIFLFDDTMIPDTPEQAAGRAAHQAAVEHAQLLAANPALAEAERTARQAAQEAAWKSSREKLAPWLVKPLTLPNGEPTSRLAKEAHTRSNLLSLSSHLSAERQATLETATKTGTPTELVFPNGERAILGSFVEGQPVWTMSDSLTQAVSIATADVWPGGAAGFSLTGTDSTIGVWEAGGIPRLTHQEFQSRVSVADGTTNVDSHATAVASVLNAAGLYTIEYPAGVTNPQAAKGMLYAAPAVANNKDNDYSEMASEAATNSLRVSNHSYSDQSGWRWIGVWGWFGDTNVSQTVDWKFGAYTSEPYSIDTTVYTAATYLPIWTPGNSGGEGPPAQPTNHYYFPPGSQTGYLVTGVTRSIDGDAGGYDSIHPQGCAKNVLTVGNVSNLVAGYTGPASVRVGPFSPFGPTDDGRLKPDIVAPGTDIIMADSPSDAAFQLNSDQFRRSGRYRLHQPSEPIARDFADRRPPVAGVHHEGPRHPHCGRSRRSSGPDYRFGWDS